MGDGNRFGLGNWGLVKCEILGANRATVFGSCSIQQEIYGKTLVYFSSNPGNPKPLLICFPSAPCCDHLVGNFQTMDLYSLMREALAYSEDHGNSHPPRTHQTTDIDFSWVLTEDRTNT